MYKGPGYTNAGLQQLTHEHTHARPTTRTREEGCASTCTCVVRPYKTTQTSPRRLIISQHVHAQPQTGT